MNNRSGISLVVVTLLVLAYNTFAQGKYEDYQRAEKFIHANILELISDGRVYPNWINNTDNFWYRIKTSNGYGFYLINSDEGNKNHAFDHNRLASILSTQNDTTFTPYELPFKKIEFTEDMVSIKIEVEKKNYEVNLSTYELTEIEAPEKKKNNLSPDGQWQIVAKDYNLYLKSISSGKETQLTNDGTELYDYGYWPSWYAQKNETDPNQDETREIGVTWSPDSKKFVTYRLDRTQMQKLHLLKSVAEEGFRPEVWSYERALVGDSLLTMVEYVVFDVDSKLATKIDLGKTPAFLNWGSMEWFKDSKHLNTFMVERFHRKVKVYDINAESGKSRLVCADSSESYVDPGIFWMKIIGDGDKVIISSERDGWNHLYLFDWKTGELINQITNGEFVVRSIEEIDEENEVIYFRAGGKEPGRDPYLRHFYKVNFDGSVLTLLSEEESDHLITISPSKKYFVDVFSTIITKPKSVLKRISDGKIVVNLEEANYDKLYDIGFKHPEPFKVKARDGKTDMYGSIFYPTTFDASKKYPIIVGTYSGPHTIRTAKYQWYDGYNKWNQSLAELGFIVITCDGLGSAFRSKEFHLSSYMNLGDIGAADTKEAIRQLAKKYTYLDTERIGIWGHSAGGYDAAHALMEYNDFYKVGVSVSADHDHRMEKIWWPELWMGPNGPHYNEQSNVTVAHKLKGDLLLIHGDMDNNVNPDATLAVADALIKANKDFDLLIMPGKDHGSVLYNNYFLRAKWDYFVEHLMGITPPKEYEFGANNK